MFYLNKCLKKKIKNSISRLGGEVTTYHYLGSNGHRLKAIKYANVRTENKREFSSCLYCPLDYNNNKKSKQSMFLG